MSSTTVYAASPSFLLANETSIRLGVFLLVFIVMAAMETLFPRKRRATQHRARWTTNWAFLMIDMLALRVVMPVLAVGAAVIADREGWGLFNRLDVPEWTGVLASVVLLDLLIYIQHAAFHRIPALWRIHKVHHADRDIDVSTGFRFHPLEILLSMGFKAVCVIALGAPAIAVVLFEIMLNAVTLFNHANARLPQPVDASLRKLIVTPDMHRVHHSVHRTETNSNYGSIASVWDRLFRTYVAQPRDGHEKMIIGLAEHQDRGPERLIWSLTLPFGPAPATDPSERSGQA